MKNLIILFSIFSTFVISGCLVYRQMMVTITFADDFKSGVIEVDYSGLASSDSSAAKQLQDFNDLMAMLDDDEFLLDSVDDGIYVKKRNLYERNGMLSGTYSGIFRKLKLDGEQLQEKGQERILQIDTDEDDVVTSNGKIYKSDKITFIIWPKEERTLSYTVKKTFDQPVFSMLPYYKLHNQH